MIRIHSPHGHWYTVSEDELEALLYQTGLTTDHIVNNIVVEEELEESSDSE